MDYISQEYRRLIRRLKKNISRRVKTLENKGLNTRAVDLYKNLNTSTRGKSLNELRTLYRDLHYINDLKSSRIKYYENYKKVVEVKTQTVYDDTELWDLYAQLVEENGLVENYKYEVIETINKEMIEGKDKEEIRKKILKQFKDKKIENNEPKPNFSV